MVKRGDTARPCDDLFAALSPIAAAASPRATSTIPANTGSGATLATASCKACPNGQFRDAYTKSASCAPCGPGKEVGPSSKMSCTMW